jgi:hypothetical protein
MVFYGVFQFDYFKILFIFLFISFNLNLMFCPKILNILNCFFGYFLYSNCFYTLDGYFHYNIIQDFVWSYNIIPFIFTLL